MKIKLMRIYGRVLSSDYDEIRIHYARGFSDWEEKTEDEIRNLAKWVWEHNNTYSRNYNSPEEMYTYEIVSPVESEVINGSIEKMLEKDRIKLKELEKEREAVKAREKIAKDKREEARKARELKKKQALLEKLRKELHGTS